MPPIPKITKEQVLDAAYEITKTEGIAAVNARSIAKRLKCSTHPVFRVYENMESLKEDIVKRAEKHYNTRMMSGLEHPVPFLGMGIAYIQFAKEEKQLFKLLFLNESFSIHSFDDMVQGDDNEQIVQMIAGSTQISTEQAKRVFLSIWLLMHGIATMIATNNAEIPIAELEDILTRGFKGFLQQEKRGNTDD